MMLLFSFSELKFEFIEFLFEFVEFLFEFVEKNPKNVLARKGLTENAVFMVVIS